MLKKLSGAGNERKRRAREAENEKQAAQMAKFLKRPGPHPDPTQPPSTSKESTVESEAQAVALDEAIFENLPCSEEERSFSMDIAKWPSYLSSQVIDMIVEEGPQNGKLDDDKYPKNEKGRHFSNSHFKKSMPNGEVYERQWLVYSNSTKKVYCFCCHIFKCTSRCHLSNVGSDNWHHLSRLLTSHEFSDDHQQALLTWLETAKRLKKCCGIDKGLQKQLEDEKARWSSVMERMIAITLFLAEHNLPFRGSKDTLYTPRNGNFLGLVQLLGQFDPVMMEHLRRVMQKESKHFYFSKNIQNEVIKLLADEVRGQILSKIRSAKYFSIILDCTPDISHTEQMSVTFRFFDVDEARVRECFLTYKPVADSTGAGLTGLFLDEIIDKYGIDMNDCRGQGYDNGANMVGHIKGVQSRIAKTYPRAFFNPCGCHSLNLVVADAAKTSIKSVSLFGVLQRLFVYFSNSTKRWKVVSEHLQNLSLKKVCDTRWESRINSLKAVRYQYAEVKRALEDEYEQSTDPVASSEAESLLVNLEKFEFLMALVIWYDVLFQVNLVSKTMQSETMDLSEATKIMNKCLKFLKEYRSTGFTSALITAKEIAEEAQITQEFETVRLRRKKKMFSYENQDESPTDPETAFRTSVFYPMIDTAINSLQLRFSQLSDINSTWQFMYDLKKIDHNGLNAACSDLESVLTHGALSDISGTELAQEIRSLSAFLGGDDGHPKGVLEFLAKHCWKDMFPNVWTALRIFITIPVTVAKGERSFSKLKLIKTYLRSVLADEKLSDLAILSIENEIANNLSYDHLIKKFASIKARKEKFQ